MERTTTIEWRGRRVDAADPAPIATTEFELSAATVRATERAATSTQLLGHQHGGAAEIAGRLALRAEGLSSSAIEGLRSPTEAVVLAEHGVGEDATAAWVADNLAVVTDALTTPPPLSTDTVLAWHRRLMRHAIDFDPEHVGTWRPVLGWIGGANPLVAAHVAAPPDRIAGAMEDLVDFVARDDLDPVTLAAVAHAQFETIHPFADGNGRIGRVLIGWILATRLELPAPPPVSTAFARDIGGYLSGLTLYRQGHLDHWVRWFADAVQGAAERSGLVLDAVAQLRSAWDEATADLRADATARAVLDLLLRQPVIDVGLVAEARSVSATAARGALRQLAELGILTELAPVSTGRGRPSTWWAAQDLLALVGP